MVLACRFYSDKVCLIGILLIWNLDTERTMDLAIFTAKNTTYRDSWLDKPVFTWWPALTIEKLLIILILVLTIFTRFYNLGARTMSHDEINHVVPAYNFNTYVYDPVTHGPFQFHALAFSYFMFGDSDFSARIPAAIFGIAIVAFAIFAWRRYLGRVGSLVAGILLMISPYILFYSRYTRNEVFIVFWGIVLLWLLLRYLEDGKHKWLYWLVFITAMHYVDKATSFIFSAEALIFLALLFISEVLRKHWSNQGAKTRFQLAVVATLVMLVVTMGIYVLHNTPTASQPAILDPNTGVPVETFVINSSIPLILSLGLTVMVVVFALYTLFKGFGWKNLSHLRSFDLIWLQLILILPLLTALPLKLLGFDPTDYSQSGIIRSGIVFALLLLISVVLGMLWNRKIFLRSMAIFWGIFIVFYTTVFSHGDGFFQGIVGALGYWMSQQAVERGTQPLYYYALVQVPMYEYLPAFGVVVAFFIGLKKRLFFARSEDPFTPAPKPEIEIEDLSQEELLPEVELVDEIEIIAEIPVTADDGVLIISEELREGEPEVSTGWLQKIFPDVPELGEKAAELPTLLLLVYWSVMSLLAFSLAGERMPWLTTHITMPMILTCAWAVGYLVEHLDWQSIWQKKGLIVTVLIPIFVIAFGSLVGSLFGTTPPFQGKDLAQLQATSTFLLALIGTLGSGIALFYIVKNWSGRAFAHLLLLGFMGLLAIQTARTAWRAAFIDYDNARELLVYAHSTEDMKSTVEQIETISKRLYGDKSIKIAYDNDVRYPYWWYMRDYPNKYDFNTEVTKSLQDYPIIVVGTSNYARIEPVVRDDYYKYDYKRMWWPNEELYRNWTVKRVWSDLNNPAKRSALWQLWFNRDYREYAVAFNNPGLTLATWSPSDTARMFIRKDVAAKIWEFGISPEPAAPKVDPYAEGTISLEPQTVISAAGEMVFSAPRDMATAPDGSLYVADSLNHRIVHLDPNGLFLNAWGGYGNVLDGEVPGGLLNEPWGVSVGPDGMVYVADTWNHRIQVFTSEGLFVRMWSTFNAGGFEDGFWGPRGIVVDAQNRVYVTDTGKQRVVIFDSMGNYLTQFGSLGMDMGKLDEPVGIDLDADGRVYVADTWNYRVQVFEPDESGLQFRAVSFWEVDAWQSQSLDNKPFLALDQNGRVILTDPDRGRVIVFDQNGQFEFLWGGFDNSYTMTTISGVTIAFNGDVWVTDSANNSLLKFVVP